MLTRSLQAKLEKLFSQFGNTDEHFNINELQGFMHALVITPDIIKPREWIPKIFIDQMPEYNSIEQAQAVMDTMLDVYNRYNDLRIKGKLKFPYNIGKIDDDLFDDIMDWCWGFLDGLRLRMDIWLSRVIAEELGIDEDPVANSVAVFKALADDSFDATPIIEKIRAEFSEEMSEEEMESRLTAFLLMALPGAVQTLQEFGNMMDEDRIREEAMQQPTRSGKIGRNDPCPCGSGKKFKKCCGQHGQDGHVH